VTEKDDPDRQVEVGILARHEGRRHAREKDEARRRDEEAPDARGWRGPRSADRDGVAHDDREKHERDRPDVVVVLLGVNDVYYERTDPAPPEVVARTVARLATIVSEARATGATVLLGTALPNHRDPPARVAALNAAVGTLAPDHLPTGERFGERDWPRLLADDVHPNGDGYQVLADVLAEELVRRGLVRQ